MPKISELPAATAANPTDQLEVNQAGVSKRVTVDQLMDAGGGDFLPLTGGTLSGTVRLTGVENSQLQIANGAVDWHANVSGAGNFYLMDATHAAYPILVEHTTGAVTMSGGITSNYASLIYGATLGGALTGTSANFTDTVTTLSGTAVGAGANTQAFVKASATANLGIYYGTGAPSFTAAKGSLYSNTTATTTTTRLYVNTDSGTTWANLTTSA